MLLHHVAMVMYNYRGTGVLLMVMLYTGVLLMVVLGVAVGIIVGALLLCVISHFTRRSSQCRYFLSLDWLRTRSGSTVFLLEQTRSVSFFFFWGGGF